MLGSSREPLVHLGPVVAKNKELKAIICQNCGFAHLYPLPSYEAVQSLYSSDSFYTSGGKAWFEKERGEHEKGYWDSEYRLRRDLLGSDRYLWDVGCGTGEFVAWWQENCYPYLASGYEPSRLAKRSSPVEGSIVSDIDDVMQDIVIQRGYGVGKPALCFSLVFEHVRDPVSELRRWYDMLGFDTRVLVKVPNEFNPLQKRLEKRYGSWFVVKEHLNYFTPYGLRKMVTDAGLQVVWEGATFPMELFALLGLNYIGNDELGRKCHLARLRFEKAVRGAFGLYRLLYNKFGWGRELIFCVEGRLND